ncbi:MAG: HPr family phosphocarrier protein [Desulfobacteraceae bacterium]|nr:HPr family phosphocarrier protein [Desulfobacteraceae bacterium]MCF8094224.1 HPr family phosphocarrier protein [Desulfobacteraceae bacterium]
MDQLEKNLSKEVTVVNELGLHARPAAMIAKLALQAKAGVWLIKNGEQVDATSIIDILSLSGTRESRITLRIENPSDTEILEKISTLFESGFKE